MINKRSGHKKESKDKYLVEFGGRKRKGKLCHYSLRINNFIKMKNKCVVL